MHGERGLIGAALTPRGKRGELNFGASFELIDQLCGAGLHGIALLTATGEYPAFTIEERTRLVYLGVKRSRAPIFAGAGAEDLDTAVEIGREALAAGATGVILPPPLLFSYPPADLREYYLQFAGQVGTGAEIWIDGAAPTDALMDTGRFAGVVGSGMTLSAEASAIPELVVGLECARKSGDAAALQRYTDSMAEFQQRAERFAPLVALKIAASMRGIPMGTLPVPVAPERAGEVDEFREWFRAWLPAVRKMARHA
jgi:4-hydroxy-tetrahydrodipicolinate synthase